MNVMIKHKCMCVYVCVAGSLTLDVEDHLRLHRAHIIGGGAAVLPGIGLRHLIDPQHAALHHDVIRQSPAHFTPFDRGLGVADRLALKLHGVADHHSLHGRTHVDHHLGQGWEEEEEEEELLYFQFGWLVFTLAY